MFESDGTKDGYYSKAEFKVNTKTDQSQDTPSIASLANGGFVVTWESWKQDGDSDGVYGQIYDCLLYTSPSPRDGLLSRMPSSA